MNRVTWTGDHHATSSKASLEQSCSWIFCLTGDRLGRKIQKVCKFFSRIWSSIVNRDGVDTPRAEFRFELSSPVPSSVPSWPPEPSFPSRAWDGVIFRPVFNPKILPFYWLLSTEVLEKVATCRLRVNSETIPFKRNHPLFWTIPYFQAKSFPNNTRNHPLI